MANPFVTAGIGLGAGLLRSLLGRNQNRSISGNRLEVCKRHDRGTVT